MTTVKLQLSDIHNNMLVLFRFGDYFSICFRFLQGWSYSVQPSSETSTGHQSRPCSMAAAASRSLSAAAGEAAQLRDVVAPKLSVATIKPRVVAAEYAVRGEIVRRAQLLEDELQAGKRKFPFEKVGGSSCSWSSRRSTWYSSSSSTPISMESRALVLSIPCSVFWPATSLSAAPGRVT